MGSSEAQHWGRLGLGGAPRSLWTGASGSVVWPRGLRLSLRVLGVPRRSGWSRLRGPGVSGCRSGASGAGWGPVRGFRGVLLGVFRGAGWGPVRGFRGVLLGVRGCCLGSGGAGWGLRGPVGVLQRLLGVPGRRLGSFGSGWGSGGPVGAPGASVWGSGGSSGGSHRVSRPLLASHNLASTPPLGDVPRGTIRVVARHTKRSVVPYDASFSTPRAHARRVQSG